MIIKQMLILTLLFLIEDLIFIFALKKQEFLNLNSEESHGGVYAFKLFAAVCCAILLPLLGFDSISLGAQLAVAVLFAAVIIALDLRDKRINKWIFDITLLVNTSVAVFLFDGIIDEKDSFYRIIYTVVAAIFAGFAAGIYSGIKTSLLKAKRPVWQKIAYAISALIILWVVYNSLEIVIQFEDLKELIPTS